MHTIYILKDEEIDYRLEEKLLLFLWNKKHPNKQTNTVFVIFQPHLQSAGPRWPCSSWIVLPATCLRSPQSSVASHTPLAASVFEKPSEFNSSTHVWQMRGSKSPLTLMTQTIWKYCQFFNLRGTLGYTSIIGSVIPRSNILVPIAGHRGAEF